MMGNRKQIRDAILANRGGFEKASDSEIMAIWSSLDEATQKSYLESIKKKPELKEKPNAVSD